MAQSNPIAFPSDGTTGSAFLFIPLLDMIHTRPLILWPRILFSFSKYTGNSSHTSLGSLHLLVSKDSLHSECVCMNVCKCMDCSGHARMDQLLRPLCACIDSNLTQLQFLTNRTEFSSRHLETAPSSGQSLGSVNLQFSS